MKKKEWIAILLIVVASLVALLSMKLARANSLAEGFGKHASQVDDPYANAPEPQQEAAGDWIAVLHRNRIAMYFDSGIDAEYTVEGNLGEMVIEVSDRKWHVKEVHCYDYTCQRMGWNDVEGIMPIICIPNDIVIVPAADAWSYLE